MSLIDTMGGFPLDSKTIDILNNKVDFKWSVPDNIVDGSEYCLVAYVDGKVVAIKTITARTMQVDGIRISLFSPYNEEKIAYVDKGNQYSVYVTISGEYLPSETEMLDNISEVFPEGWTYRAVSRKFDGDEKYVIRYIVTVPSDSDDNIYDFGVQYGDKRDDVYMFVGVTECQVITYSPVGEKNVLKDTTIPSGVIANKVLDNTGYILINSNMAQSLSGNFYFSDSGYSRVTMTIPCAKSVYIYLNSEFGHIDMPECTDLYKLYSYYEGQCGRVDDLINYTTVSIPNLTYLHNQALAGFTAQSFYSFPKLQRIDVGGFYLNNLVSFYAPNVTYIENNCFDKCKYLTEINLPNLSSWGYGSGWYDYEYAIIGAQLNNLTSLNLPKLQSLPAYLIGAPKLSYINFPEVRYLSGSQTFGGIFDGCPITEAHFPKLEQMRPTLFRSTTGSHISLYLDGSVYCKGAATGEDNITIYVPSSYYSRYIYDYKWSNYWYKFTSDETMPIVPSASIKFKLTSNTNAHPSATLSTDGYHYTNDVYNYVGPGFFGSWGGIYKDIKVPCSYLTEVYLSDANGYIGKSAFESQSTLTTAYFPTIRVISDKAFYGCTKLTNLNISNCVILGSNVFGAYGETVPLTTLRFNNLQYIGGYLGNGLTNLKSLYLMGSSIVQRSGSLFSSTPKSLKIYVPTSLLNNYKTHSSWSIYSSLFVGV